MKPAPFEYRAPDSLEAALELMLEHGADAKLLAGGQSLIPVMNFRLAQPALLVDLNELDDLDYVRSGDDGTLRVGALTRMSRFENLPDLGRYAPLLAEAVPHIAHPQIRNRSTFGGTLSHADPAAEAPAVCVAHQARFRLARAGSDRWVEATDFFTGLFETALAPEEILVEVELKAPAEGTGTSFQEIARRHGDYALAGIAASVTLGADGRIAAARLIYLSVGDQPVDAAAASALLIGEVPSDELFAAAGEEASQRAIDPAGTIHATPAFTRHLVGVLTRRALATASQRAADSEASLKDGAV